MITFRTHSQDLTVFHDALGLSHTAVVELILQGFAIKCSIASVGHEGLRWVQRVGQLALVDPLRSKALASAG